jgi:hypothetical protein
VFGEFQGLMMKGHRRLRTEALGQKGFSPLGLRSKSCSIAHPFNRTHPAATKGGLKVSRQMLLSIMLTMGIGSLDETWLYWIVSVIGSWAG